MATLDREGPLREEAVHAGFGDIPEFPLTSFYNANFVAQVRRCAAYLREQKIDLVHTHDFYTNVFGMAAAGLARVPVRIASKRETAGMRSRAQEFVERVAFGRASAVLANSNAVRDHLTGRGLSAEKVRVVYNGLETESFDTSSHGGAIRERYGLPENSKLVTLVANLRHSVKNVPMLLRCAKRVLEKVPDVHFVVAGEGDLRNGLEGLAVMLGVARNVHFIGRCDDVPSLLAASSACVLTSQAEGFANSIIEYMAAGKPVVATRVGGAAEAVVEAETGYLVEADDDEAMAERLVSLLRDPAMATRLGHEGKHVVSSKFSAARQLADTISLYNSLLGET